MFSGYLLINSEKKRLNPPQVKSCVHSIEVFLWCQGILCGYNFHFFRLGPLTNSLRDRDFNWFIRCGMFLVFLLFPFMYYFFFFYLFGLLFFPEEFPLSLSFILFFLLSLICFICSICSLFFSSSFLFCLPRLENSFVKL